MDRFAQGLPDPQDKTVELVDECTSDDCQAPIYSGDQVWRYDGDLYCSFKCLAIDLGAIKLEAGE